jgi:hypothetical protein
MCHIFGRCEANLGRENWPEERDEYYRIQAEEIDIRESYWVVEAQSKNKTEERKLGTDLPTEFVQGASKSGSVEAFVCYYYSNLMKCYKYL